MFLSSSLKLLWAYGVFSQFLTFFTVAHLFSLQRKSRECRGIVIKDSRLITTSARIFLVSVFYGILSVEVLKQLHHHAVSLSFLSQCRIQIQMSLVCMIGFRYTPSVLRLVFQDRAKTFFRHPLSCPTFCFLTQYVCPVFSSQLHVMCSILHKWHKGMGVSVNVILWSRLELYFFFHHYGTRVISFSCYRFNDVGLD